MNGINKYVTEMSEETHVESIGEKSTVKLVAKARPEQTSDSTLSPVCIPYLRTKVDRRGTRNIDQNCLEVSKLMIRLLRNDNSVIEKRTESRITYSPHWSIPNMAQFLAKRRWD